MKIFLHVTSVLDEVKPKEINFMSLDVEGYELNVLKGLDFEKYSPEIIVDGHRFN